MCGRFALHLDDDEVMALDARQRVRPNRWINRDRYVPRYNVAPRTHGLVVRRDDEQDVQENTNAPDDNAEATAPETAGNNASEPGPSNTRKPEMQVLIQSMKWGLVPHWSKYEDKSLSTMNARSEALVEGTGMWNSLKGNRCAVVCQGYYEWKTKGKDKIPHFTSHPDAKVMLLAGLWDVVTLKDETEPLYTFTIVTTSAAKEYEWLHDRQPVILHSQEALNLWLSSERWSTQHNKLLDPYSGPKLDCYQVPSEVGKVGKESASFIKPVNQRKDGIEAMFSKQKAQGSKSSKSEPQEDRKRKRDDEEEKVEEEETDKSASQTKVEKTEDDVIVLDSPPSPFKRKPGTKPSTPKKRQKTDAFQESSTKLTTFFSSPTSSTPKKRQKSENSPESSTKLTSFFPSTPPKQSGSQ